MKPSNTEIGREAEFHACQFLYDIGFKILERNWRFSRAEVDIIAVHAGILHFIEVKSRSSTYYGAPETAINDSKQELIIDAAYRYMHSKCYDWAIQFDIIAVYLDQCAYPRLLKFYEDAFF